MRQVIPKIEYGENPEIEIESDGDRGPKVEVTAVMVAMNLVLILYMFFGDNERR